jgi:hypothetical protein
VQAFDYSLANGLPSLGFSGNRIVALFQSTLTDILHTFYLEPEVNLPDHAVYHYLLPTVSAPL